MRLPELEKRMTGRKGLFFAQPRVNTFSFLLHWLIGSVRGATKDDSKQTKPTEASPTIPCMEVFRNPPFTAIGFQTQAIVWPMVSQGQQAPYRAFPDGELSSLWPEGPIEPKHPCSAYENDP